MTKIKYEIIDLTDSKQNNAVIFLLNEYAKELKGFNKELPKEVLDNLIPELNKLNNYLVILANKDNNYIGMVIGFIGFSTFYAKPIINIHDLTVLKEFRKQGIGTNLIKEIEKQANELKCCKITLEVQEHNKNALKLYENLGFSKNGYNPDEGNALFLMKII